ncbi:hypothetical protein E2P81_ATG02063 [Venturia nashicola]|uniref:Uncharacterized protein n=1 Tax=Venturia nashicola TaxID=86259 RepID=A0A4Z1P2M9_9PEZI|nr:hypothetical protein E6O75_ATG02111 [Venturia nashicola]TLD35760.1 hypothetical protein E2P81_ATG02063 [Venturia nashicola]
MSDIHRQEFALSDCLCLRQRNEQVQGLTIDESEVEYWLIGISSWVQPNEPSSAQKISINLEDNDVKPPQVADLPSSNASGSFDGSFECGGRRRWNDHWSMNEAKRQTGGDADARRGTEAGVDRVGQDNKVEDANGLGTIKDVACHYTGSVKGSRVVHLAVDERLVSSGRERNGEMLLRWSEKTLEDAWYPGRGKEVLQYTGFEREQTGLQGQYRMRYCLSCLGSAVPGEDEQVSV